MFNNSEKTIPSSVKSEVYPIKELDKKTEAVLEKYGLPEIDNPEILRLISEIDLFDCSPEKIDSLMSRIARDNENPELIYTLAYVLANRAKDIARGAEPQQALLYGYQGMNRYSVYPDGRLSLLTGDNIKPDVRAIKKAQELGMVVE